MGLLYEVPDVYLLTQWWQSKIDSCDNTLIWLVFWIRSK